MPKYSTLREKVYKYLRKELTRGSLASGDFVDQNKICQHLGISRAPLRDALIQLETEGFLEIQPRRGVKIRPLSLQDIKDSYDVLGTLESGKLASLIAVDGDPEEDVGILQDLNKITLIIKEGEIHKHIRQ